MVKCQQKKFKKEAWGEHALKSAGLNATYDDCLKIFNDFFETGDKVKQSHQLASLVTQK